MKIRNLILTAVITAATVIATAPAFAQGRGFDTFGAPRAMILVTPQTLAAASTVSKTNDTQGYLGIAKITLFSYTNGAAGSVTATLEGSSDMATWSAITYAKAVSASVTYTNRAIANGNCTDTFLLPGTWTTPTATSDGWATAYLSPAPFTNVAAVTVTGATITEVGYNVADAPRYFRVTWTATGSVSSNAVVAAILTGNRGSEVRGN